MDKLMQLLSVVILVIAFVFMIEHFLTNKTKYGLPIRLGIFVVALVVLLYVHKRSDETLKKSKED